MTLSLNLVSLYRAKKLVMVGTGVLLLALAHTSAVHPLLQIPADFGATAAPIWSTNTETRECRRLSKLTRPPLCCSRSPRSLSLSRARARGLSHALAPSLRLSISSMVHVVGTVSLSFTVPSPPSITVQSPHSMTGGWLHTDFVMARKEFTAPASITHAVVFVTAQQSPVCTPDPRLVGNDYGACALRVESVVVLLL